MTRRILILICTLFCSGPVFSQTEPPRSSIPLVNRINWLISAGYISEGVNNEIAKDLAASTNQGGTFNDLLRVIDMFSLETIQGVRSRVLNLPDSNFELSEMRTDAGRLLFLLRDPALIRADTNGFATQRSPFGVVFGQLYLLSPAAYERFAKDFIALVQLSHARNVDINKLLLASYVEKRKREMDTALKAAKVKLPVRAAAIANELPKVQEEFKRSVALTRTYATTLLYQAFDTPADAYLDLETLPTPEEMALRNQRVADLIQRAMTETSAFNDQQIELIRARAVTRSGLPDTSPKLRTTLESIAGNRPSTATLPTCDGTLTIAR